MDSNLCSGSADSALPAAHIRLRLLIADDHRIVRDSVRCWLEGTGQVAVVAEAEDGEEALTAIAEYRPDVALLDLRMPKLSGIEVIRRAVLAETQTRILVFSGCYEACGIREALSAGASGFLPKSAAACDLLTALQAIMTGRSYVHADMLDGLIAAIAAPEVRDSSELSQREAGVLRLIALGYSNKEIASRLDVSVKTVETYKARGAGKIGAPSRVEIVRYAVKRGWLDSSPLSDDERLPNPIPLASRAKCHRIA